MSDTVSRIDGFKNDTNEAESILIGQLGKSYNYKDKIDGKTLLNYAIGNIYRIHNLIGSRIVFLECLNNEKVVKFYQDNGFVFLQESGDYLQMVRHL